MPRIGGSQTGQSYLIASKRVSMGTLPTTAEFAPAPSSGNGVGDLSSLVGVGQRPPSSQRSFVASAGSLSRGTASFMSPRLSPLRVRSATTSELPVLSVTNKYATGPKDESSEKRSRKIWKAAEGGKGSLLPDFTTTVAPTPTFRREPPSRSKSSGPSIQSSTSSMRSRSSQALPQIHQDINNGGSSTPAKSSLSLRRRTATGASDDELDMNTSVASGRREYRTDSDTFYRRRNSDGNGQPVSPRPSWGQQQWNKLSRMKVGHILQVVIVLAVTALVWESHHKALFAAQQLTQFKEEESLLLLHLQKIEQQSIQLHENLSRLARVGLAGKAEAKNANGNGEGGREVDFDLIHKQTQQLYQMEEELNHEVKALQTRIQQSARNHIIQEFGEGPVQVILELDFGPGSENGVNTVSGAADAGPNRISILLWHDTPHAAWTWLEQIGRKVWDGAEFHWKQGHIIDAIPHEIDPMGGKIEFVEQSQHRHEAWTVGVREYDSGTIGMYINLQDNSNLHKHETCVGKVIDGFDALQRLLEVARTQRYEKDISIVVRKATATHVTKK